jgi:hypothetical protein
VIESATWPSWHRPYTRPRTLLKATSIYHRRTIQVCSLCSPLDQSDELFNGEENPENDPFENVLRLDIILVVLYGRSFSLSRLYCQQTAQQTIRLDTKCRISLSNVHRSLSRLSHSIDFYSAEHEEQVLTELKISEVLLFLNSSFDVSCGCNFSQGTQ